MKILSDILDLIKALALVAATIRLCMIGEFTAGVLCIIALELNSIKNKLK